MNYIILFSLVIACVLVDGQRQFYSFSPAVGQGGGSAFSLSGEGRITAVRVWEASSGYVYGFQFRYGYIWSAIVGRKIGRTLEINLHDNEAIIQVSGKYTRYLQSVVFTTTEGRTLHAGQPAGYSFDMYPAHSKAELRLISGRYRGAITSFAAHWAVYNPASNSTSGN